MSTVTKAVIPAAGRGTLLPVTKTRRRCSRGRHAIIQYVVEEAVAAGLTDILIITAASTHYNHSIRTSISSCSSSSDKGAKLSEPQALDDLADIHYIRQTEQLGLGHGRSAATTWVTSRSPCCSATTSWSTMLRSSAHARRARARARRCSCYRGHPGGDRIAGCAEIDR
jgi:UTP-glucose-1-phosphate uridylyltransferase